MTTLLDPLDVLTPPPPAGRLDHDDRGDEGGFLDCRGVAHRWAEED